MMGDCEEISGSLNRRLQQLKDWQKEQQTRLLEQQRQQIESLRLEQERIKQMLLQSNSLSFLQGDRDSSSCSSNGSPFKSNDVNSEQVLQTTRLEMLLKNVALLADDDGSFLSTVPEDNLLAEEEDVSYASEAEVASFNVSEMEEIEFEDDISEDQNESNDFQEEMQDSSEKLKEQELLDTSSERPILPIIGRKVKNFEELVELRLSSEMNESVDKSMEKEEKQRVPVKRNFLKKGEGTARFNGKGKKDLRFSLNSHAKVKRTDFAKQSHKVVSHIVKPSKVTLKESPKSLHAFEPQRECDNENGDILENKKDNIFEKHFVTDGYGSILSSISEAVEDIVEEPLDEKISPMSNHYIFENEQSLEMTPQKNVYASDRSFILKIEEMKMKKKIEQEDLMEFEVLEKASEDSSFCSTSTVVRKALERKILSSPFKSISKKKMLPRIIESGHPSNDHDKNCKKKIPSDREVNNPTKSTKQLDYSESQHTHENNSERAVAESQQNTTSVNGISKNIAGSVEDIIKADDAKVAGHISSISHQFEDDETWSEISDKSIDTTESTHFESIEDANVTLRATSRAAKQTPKQTGNKKFIQDTLNLSTEDEVCISTANFTVVRESMQKLEKEIQCFRTERSNLAKLQSKHKKNAEKIEMEKAVFLKRKENEQQQFQKYMEEEKQKLQKEKQLHAAQMRTRGQIVGKEKEEIKRLLHEISELKAQIEEKETKWTASTSKLKDRLKSLRLENDELKKELEKEREQNSKGNARSPLKEIQLPINSQVKVNEIKEKRISESQNLYPTKTKTRVAFKRPIIRDASSSSSSEDEIADALSTSSPSQEDCTIDPKMRFVKESSIVLEESKHANGTIERIYSDNVREVCYANNTRKEISSDGQSVVVFFYNGDIKRIYPDRRIVYYFGESNATHTTYADGLQVYHFANNQIEKHYPDGSQEIQYPDRSVKYLLPDGLEETILLDGTIVQIDPNGEKTLLFPNGQKEVHTNNYKKREYPDGTMKFVFPDGRQETHYANGRVRIKSGDGTIIQDNMFN